MPRKFKAIYRYPVKGLSPAAVGGVGSAPGGPLPADRLYAIENGPSASTRPPPRLFPKTAS